MLVEFSIIPIGTGVSLSAQIAKVLDLVDNSGVSYRLNPMGTVLEGEWDEILTLIKRCHEAVLEDAERVCTTIKIDDRKGVEGAIFKKVESVERLLGRKLKT